MTHTTESFEGGVVAESSEQVLFEEIKEKTKNSPRKRLLVWTLALAMGMSAEAYGVSGEKKDVVDPETRSKIAHHIHEKLGDAALAEIENLDSVKNEAERATYIKEHQAMPLEVSGFERCSGCPSNAEIKEVFEKLPMSYRHNVRNIKYDDAAIAMPDAYGIKSSEAAHATPDGMVFSRGVTKHVSGKPLTADDLLRTILVDTTHEAAHDGDWKSNKALTLDERMKLIEDVINRVNSMSRFKSEYVEIIKNSDKKTRLRLEASEYYAEITQAYFKGDPKLPEEDKQIVEGVIHKTDPSFKRGDADKFRGAVNAILARHSHHKNEDVYARR